MGSIDSSNNSIDYGNKIKKGAKQMEPIKELGLLIAETERAANLFGALTRLPRVLEIIMKAQNLPAELEKEIKDREAELLAVEEKIKDSVFELDKLRKSVSESQVDFNHVAGEIKEKTLKVMDLMEAEIAVARKDANDTMQELGQKLKDRIEKNDATIQESEEKMVEAVGFHRDQIEVHKAEEKRFKDLASEARATLENITKSLSGGE
jgi:hypothetical protein